MAPSDKRATSRTFALAAFVFAWVVASDLLSLGFDHLRTSLINANWEFSWSHDADIVLFAVGACVSLSGARASAAHRRQWLATAGILAALFVDEVSGVHESSAT